MTIEGSACKGLVLVSPRIDGVKLPRIVRQREFLPQGVCVECEHPKCMTRRFVLEAVCPDCHDEECIVGRTIVRAMCPNCHRAIGEGREFFFAKRAAVHRSCVPAPLG